MIEIPENILSKLKCDQCKKYLSSSPVLLKSSGENICDNCVLTASKTEETFTRNVLYENVASVFLFPCRYQSDGCTTKLIPDELKYHEMGCEFRVNDCPMSLIQNCTWSGKNTELKHHFKEMHPKSIVKYPHSFQPDIVQNNEQYFLMEVFNFLFLVQMKCNITVAKLWYCVRFIGNPKFAKLFDYVVKIGKDDESVTKKRSVESIETLLFSASKFIEIKTNSMLSTLDNCCIENLSCTIKVKLKEIKCLICMRSKVKEQIHMQNSGYICNECQNNKQIVSCDKCSFEDIKLNMQKHKLMLCKFGEKQCSRNGRCNINWTHTNYFDHLLTSHYQKTEPLKIKTMKYEQTHYFAESLDGVIFLTRYRFTESKLNLTINSSLPKIQNIDYKCILTVRNPVTNFEIEKELNILMYDDDYDWSIEIVDDPNNSLVYIKNKNRPILREYETKLIIEKRNKI